LHIFCHLAQKSFDRRQPACTIFAQSDKKSDGASDAQSLCGVALVVQRLDLTVAASLPAGSEIPFYTFI
jgi:hypothetical protein